MDPVRLGSDVRLLRSRKGWTQTRLANEARVPRWIVVEIEAGQAERARLEHLARVVTAAGAYLNVRIQFQGEGLDRLRDRAHAALVDRMVERLRADGWEIATEVSFNVFGERGSIDILAFHAPTGALLVIEVKSVVPDVGGMLATIDRKVRLAAKIARERGWQAGSVSRLLVVGEASTARRRVEQHDATFAVAFPERTVVVKRWLRDPSGSISGLLFLPSDQPADSRRSRPTAAASQEPEPRSDGMRADRRQGRSSSPDQLADD